MDKQYQVIGGTSYNIETPFKVALILEMARINKRRIHISIGDKITGKDWNNKHDVNGYITRSCGTVKIPLIIAKKGSMLGSPIFDDKIVKIASTGKHGKVLYQHENYHQVAE
jgi:hypothetical protein